MLCLRVDSINLSSVDYKFLTSTDLAQFAKDAVRGIYFICFTREFPPLSFQLSWHDRKSLGDLRSETQAVRPLQGRTPILPLCKAARGEISTTVPSRLGMKITRSRVPFTNTLGRKVAKFSRTGRRIIGALP